MAYIREGLSAHVQDNISPKVSSSFTLANPIFYLLGLSTPDGRNNLGRPDVSAVFGSMGKSKAQIETLAGTMDHQIRFVKAEPNDGAAVSYGGNTPTASAFAEDNFGTARTRWTHFMEPIKVRAHALEMARGETAVRSLVDDATNPVWERFVKRVNQAFWTGTRNSSQQNVNVWEDLLGLQHTLTANNVYGGVDRSVETALNPSSLVAGTDTASTVVDLDLIRKINHGFTKASSGTFTGLAMRSANGRGANAIVTTSTLWQELASQAEGRYQIHTNGIPKAGLAGFEFPVIEYDRSFITYDPYCPSGEMYALNLDTWMVEIQKGHNFKFLGFQPKWLNEEGGGYYEHGLFSAMIRFTCSAPWLNCRVSGLTTT